VTVSVLTIHSVYCDLFRALDLLKPRPCT